MGQTMVEKLFSRKSAGNTPAVAGQIVTAKLDGIMCDYKFGTVNVNAQKAGFPEGVPFVWDRDRVFILGDHHQPAPSQKLADNNLEVRRHVERLGIRTFHDAEPGISHQMVIDYKLVKPGDLVVANDSHAVGYGALNAAGTGISGIEAVYALMYGELWFQVPHSIKLNIRGKVPDYPIGKDIILYLAGKLGDDFANGLSMEVGGPSASALSMDDRLCIATHGLEVGAKFTLFEYDELTDTLLGPEQRAAMQPLVADADAVYQKVIDVDLDTMPFVVAKPHQFGNVVPIGEARGVKINQAQIGSCANGRFEDIEIAARVLRGRKVAPGVRFIISPSTQSVYLRSLLAGHIAALVDAGAQVVTPGCGICQPMVGYMSGGEVCITSTTRNYRGRKGSTDAQLYLGGPLSVAAAAVAGEIVDPREVFDGI
ncbi:aconitase/3-isopropylmalate dehydratase large subunit family protein [Pigmentiphaga soli]|uniref:Aconitase/3-isopropylmalate dehydratase large subunit family protein n=1 Tax=Pigmentiphaga soli TaxID=1007095 RepID=A0ABP8GQI6_9BURK